MLFSTIYSIYLCLSENSAVVLKLVSQLYLELVGFVEIFSFLNLE